MEKINIVTVGGSPVPVMEAVRRLDGGRLIFVCSEASEGQCAEICEEVGYAGIATTLVVDANDIGDCYKKVTQATEGKKVFAAVTGGTKAMVAGVSAAVAQAGGTLSYLQSTRRNKGGLGTGLLVSGESVCNF